MIGRTTLVASLALGVGIAAAATYVAVRAGESPSTPAGGYVVGCAPPGDHPRFVAVLLQGINSSLRSSKPFDPARVSYCAWPDGRRSSPPNNPNPALRSMADGWLNYSYNKNDNSYDKTDQATVRPGQPNLIDSLAAQRGYVLPFSYVEQPTKIGAKMTGPASSPMFGVPAYDSGVVANNDPRYDEPPALQSEVASIHQFFPTVPILLIGHSNGGLIAEQWWLRYRDAAANGVRHIYSLDSPINGVADAGACHSASPTPNLVHPLGELCELLGVGAATGDAYTTLWQDKASDPTDGDPALATLDRSTEGYTAIGSYGDPLFDAGDTDVVLSTRYGSAGYASQLVLNPTCFSEGYFGQYANESPYDPACAPLPTVDFVDPCAPRNDPEDHAAGALFGIPAGSLWMHSIVKNCPGVIDYILSSAHLSLTPHRTANSTTTSTSTASLAVTAGYGTPDDAAYGFYSGELSGSWSAACSYLTPSVQSTCSSQTSGQGAATGTVHVGQAIISGTQALVPVTGSICAPGSPCVSNTDPNTGMPQSSSDFTSAYQTAVTNGASAGNTVMSPVPTSQIDGKWYVAFGGSTNGASTGNTTGGSSSTTSSAGNTTGTSPSGGNPPGPAKHCGSNPQDQNSFYFVAQICILRVATSTSPGGSTLKVSLKITDQDPNSFGIDTTDFSVADSQGTDSAQDGIPGCLSDDNSGNPEYTLNPGQAMVLPVPVCFPLNFGGQPRSLTWEDITLPLR